MIKRKKPLRKIISSKIAKIILISGGVILTSSMFFMFYVVSAHESTETIKVLETRNVIATAYSSTADQTDSSPCITANGLNVCENNEENVIAANFLFFGTKVKLPELFGDRIFIVHDRMHSRFGGNRIDIWMTDRPKAKEFGVKRTKMEIIEIEGDEIY
ncbi:3D domain-containing protein [Patescibacteria group bacterium]|nr:3D domain-containing protein [Patescibacteria group bacterium]